MASLYKHPSASVRKTPAKKTGKWAKIPESLTIEGTKWLQDGTLVALTEEEGPLYVPALEAMRLGVETGFTLEGAPARDLWQLAQAYALQQAALGFLARREHARRELEAKLSKKWGRGPLLTACLDQLEAEGVLSHARFARMLVGLRMRVQLRGPRWVAHELMQKGLSAQEAKEAVSQPQLAESWAQAAWGRVQKELNRMGAEAPHWMVRRALYAAGFESAQITHAMMLLAQNTPDPWEGDEPPEVQEWEPPEPSDAMHDGEDAVD